MDQFILFGDSITQQSFSQEQGFAFGAALSDAYVRRLDVINRGFSGYNTRQALHVLPQAIPTPEVSKIRFMTLFLGANDSRLPETPGGPQQHVPLEEYRENLKALLTHPHVRAHQGARLILITPPPVDERMCLERAKEADPAFPDVVTRVASTTAQYAIAVRELGRDLGVEVVDVWSALIRKAGGKTDEHDSLIGSLAAPVNETFQGFFRDGLHLSPSGYKVVHEELMSLIGRVWPDQMPDELPFVLPAWSDEDAWKSIR